MKMSYWLPLAGVLIAASPAWSEPGHKHGDGHKHGHGKMMMSAEKMEERIDKRLDRMTKNLKLTDDQRSRIEGILKAKAERAKALHEQMRALHESTEKDVRAVLTADQQKTYDEKKAKMKEKRMDRTEKRTEKREKRRDKKTD